MSNFDFLKNIDNSLFKTASEAEKLYKDEYFDQCIIQTRKLAENLCKNTLKNEISANDTFDEMLATLKDKSNGSAREKEFIDDLYFLKKEGNLSAHSIQTKQSAITALECLRRAFEASLNYAISKDKTNKDLLYLDFDEELLILGVRKQKTLQEKYLEEKAKAQRNIKPQKIKTQKQNKPKKIKPLTQKTKNKTRPKITNKKIKKAKFSIFWKIITLMAIIGVIAGYFLVN